MDYDHVFKVVIVGDTDTGKTSFLRRYVDNEFRENTLTTIGVDFKIKTLTINDSTIKLHIWDTAGQERYNSLSRSYSMNSQGVILMFSYDDAKSLERINKWFKDMYSILENVNPEPYFLVVGNKNDLPTKEVTQKQVRDFLDKHSYMVQMNASAKTGENVEEIFELVARECIRRYDVAYDERQGMQNDKEVFQLEEFPKLDDGDGNDGGGKKCC